MPPKIPRDVSGKELIKTLQKIGYTPTRQTGSHIRMTSNINGQHHLTIPNHDFIRLGTLSSIISAIAKHFQVDRNDIINKIF